MGKALGAMQGAGKWYVQHATSAGKQINTGKCGKVPGTQKQPESMKRVENIQNVQFH